MNYKTGTLFVGMCVIFLVAIYLSFDKYIIRQDYYIQKQAACDPMTKNCFISICNPQEDEECPEDEADRSEYYSLIQKKAYVFSQCEKSQEGCDTGCQPGEDCLEITCSPDNGDVCSEGSSL